MGQAGPQLHEIGSQFGLTRCRGGSFQPIGAPVSKDGLPAYLKKCARVLVERNLLRLGRSLDVVLEYGIDVGNKLAQ